VEERRGKRVKGDERGEGLGVSDGESGRGGKGSDRCGGERDRKSSYVMIFMWCGTILLKGNEAV
jgi:hypothetical protein